SLPSVGMLHEAELAASEALNELEVRASYKEAEAKAAQEASQRAEAEAVRANAQAAKQQPEVERLRAAVAARQSEMEENKIRNQLEYERGRDFAGPLAKRQQDLDKDRARMEEVAEEVAAAQAALDDLQRQVDAEQEAISASNVEPSSSEPDATYQSVYKVDDKAVSFDTYCQRLGGFGILVKVRNFLVFQGDIEAVAAKTPAGLTGLLEQISGSDALKAQYDQLQAQTLAVDEKVKRGEGRTIPRYHYDSNMVDHCGKQLETTFSNMLTLLFARMLK
ncbi:structural maintenance of chromosomes protein 1, partial [Haematococcus lacustris]